MALFLTVSSGERAGLSRPIVAISDQQLIAEMLRPLGRMLEAHDTPVPASGERAHPLVTFPPTDRREAEAGGAR